jgi:fluoroquinolone transport system permease protein
VTPLPLPAYLAYRIAAPLALSVAITLVALPLAGLVSLSIAANLAAAIAAAPMAPFYALALAAFAENKVQGFALIKAMGVLTLPVCFAWFVAPPLQWLLGLDPLFWPARLYWEFAAGGGATGAAAAYLLIGLAYQALIVALLIRRFNRRVLA